MASKIQEEDPEAYEHLTGRRSDTRMGYAFLSAAGALLALPFLLISALLMVGCFLIVRLAVMLFPAFATFGAFPAARGLSSGLGTTVAAAIVNAIMFGVGACVTVVVLGILLNPRADSAGWLGLVLMPLFSFVMWMALKPFRRLTTMVSPSRNQFGNFTDSLNDPVQKTGRSLKRATVMAIAAASGGAGAGAVAAALSDDDPPERAEAQPSTWDDKEPEPRAHETPGPSTARARTRTWAAPAASVAGTPRPTVAALPVGFVPTPSAGPVPPPTTEPQWYDDGELYYPIYHPDDADAEART
jgi:hypothetical protein